MPKILTLRKCGEHEDCQLQKVDDGDWEHTPSKRTLKERLAPIRELELQLSAALSRVDELRLMLGDIKRESGAALDKVRADIPEVKDLRAQLQESLFKADYLRRLLEEERGASQRFLSNLKVDAMGLPKVLDLWRKGDRAGVQVHSQLKTAQEALERLERASERLASQEAEQANALRSLEATEAAILDAQAKTVESLQAASEKLAQADTLLTTLQERKSQLDRVDSLFDTVDELSNKLAVVTAALYASDKETRRQIEHEREERLEATAKGIRSLQSHIEVSHA